MKTQPGGLCPAPAAGPDLQPEIPGFQYADLHDPGRLRDLGGVFFREVEAADPALLSSWRAYESAPDSTPPRQASGLLVRMAPHLSRFLARLFGVQEEMARILAATRGKDPIFRFKVDFLRRRVQRNVLPEHLALFNRQEIDAAVEALL
jgi:hypothetical protein